MFLPLCVPTLSSQAQKPDELAVADKPTGLSAPVASAPKLRGEPPPVAREADRRRIRTIWCLSWFMVAYWSLLGEAGQGMGTRTTLLETALLTYDDPVSMTSVQYWISGLLGSPKLPSLVWSSAGCTKASNPSSQQYLGSCIADPASRLFGLTMEECCCWLKYETPPLFPRREAECGGPYVLYLPDNLEGMSRAYCSQVIYSPKDSRTWKKKRIFVLLV